MSGLVTKIDWPNYGEFYITNEEEVSFENLLNVQDALKKLYEYECMDKNGLLLQLPCKDGDIVFKIHELRCGVKTIPPTTIKEVRFCYNMIKMLEKQYFLQGKNLNKHIQKYIMEVCNIC